MKNTQIKLKGSMFLLVFFTIFILASCDKDEVIAEAELPTKARDFVTTHFPEQTISQVVKDKDGKSVSFDVVLDNGIDLDFKEDGSCTSIEGFSQLPDSVIPEDILAYVNQNYPENFITEWELEGNEQEVQINSGIELRFNVNGTFLNIDNE